MRLLAIDEGSKATGVAFFDGTDRPAWTGRLLPAADWDWRHRMRYQADRFRALLAVHELALETVTVIAMEGAVVARDNPRIGVRMGECRGYWLAHLDSLFGLAVPVLEIPPAAVRAAVGISAFAGRRHSKDRYRVVAEYLGLPSTATEDECDAAAVGLAGMAKLREEHWQAMAGSSASVSG